ncbi:hypothetical protein, partial [Streptomyces sp. 5-10]|uniref:hypothetical protein n=1 Tax=Streptomyces sp. 5-10 TaxID=878925 RepID=UPI001CC30EF4
LQLVNGINHNQHGTKVTNGTTVTSGIKETSGTQLQYHSGIQVPKTLWIEANTLVTEITKVKDLLKLVLMEE